jgi:thiamine biosynthesis lipoprotein
MKSNTTRIFPQNHYKLEKKYKVMGGEFHFMCFPQNNLTQEQVFQIFELAYLEVKRIEKKFTDFYPSEFNEINSMAGIEPCTVDAEIYKLIERSIGISKISGGIFDISYASIGHKWREAKQKSRTLNEQERTSALKWVNYKKIKLDSKNSSVYLPSKEMKIGLGGIGKGYAVDSAFNIMRSHGLYNFYINGSGDIRVHSHAEAPRAWRVGIKNPFSKQGDDPAGLIQMSSGSIATSGGYIQNNNLKDHHIINPKTGLSMDGIISATILADDCITADTTATIVINKTPKNALMYLNRNGITGVLIDSSGCSHLSKAALLRFSKGNARTLY